LQIALNKTTKTTKNVAKIISIFAVANIFYFNKNVL